MQSLYAIVLDCLDIPIVERADSRQPSTEASQRAPEQAEDPHQPARSVHSQAGGPHQADDQHLREILLGDDLDNDHPDAHAGTHIRNGSNTATDPYLNTADNPAVDMDSNQAQGSAVEDSRPTQPGLAQSAHAGTTLSHAGMGPSGLLSMQDGRQAGQAVLETSRPPAMLLPPYAPPQVAATEAAACAPLGHSLTSIPYVSGPVPHNRPLDRPLADVGLLDSLPDVPLRSPPTVPKAQPLPHPTDIPMIEADTQLNSASGDLHHIWQDHQLPFTDPAAAGFNPMQESTVSPAQSDEHTGRIPPNLFLTEADLLLGSPGPTPQQPAAQSQPPVVSQPAEATAGAAAQLRSQPVPSISAASLADKALQRQRSAAAPAILPTAAPAPAPAPAPTAAPARPPTPNRNMYTKSSSPHRREPNPAKVPLETKVGSLYAIYCLHETQPGHVPVYLPLELLHQLLDIVKEAHAKLACDVVQVVAQLMCKKAFVVGAIRRPPRDSPADEASLQPPNRYAFCLCCICQMYARRHTAQASATFQQGCILFLVFGPRQFIKCAFGSLALVRCTRL